MIKQRLPPVPDQCRLAQAIHILGDRWSLLIIRNAMFGTRRFVDFQQQLGIARNILQQRLEHLVKEGILRKVEVGEYGRRQQYRLTDKGRDLFVVMTALRQWGEHWGDGSPMEVLLDRKQQQPVVAGVYSASGDGLKLQDVLLGSAADL